jgi:thiol-disulfide isomerase/thioredoxin
LPFLQELYEKYKGQGLAVVAVNCDFKPDKIEQVKAYLKESRFTFPVLKDRFRALQRRYAVGSFPTMYIVDGEGKVAEVRVGYNEKTKPFPLAEIRRRLGVAGRAQ